MLALQGLNHLHKTNMMYPARMPGYLSFAAHSLSAHSRCECSNAFSTRVSHSCFEA